MQACAAFVSELKAVERQSQLANIEGLELRSEGIGPDVIFMVHGWPDTASLWDEQVEALSDRFRCVRITLPGFDIRQPRRPVGLEEMAEVLRGAIEKESPDRPVTLLLHDWGCVFGYHFAAKHPHLVSRVIGMDIGDANSEECRASLGITGAIMVFAYQFWLAVAWRIGGGLGDWMTRGMAWALGAPAVRESIGSSMNYPYDMMWFRSYGSFEALEPYRPSTPMLFFYGAKKPFQFFSEAWTDSIERWPDSRVVRVDAGHWLMKDRADEVNGILLEWLAKTASSPVGE